MDWFWGVGGMEVFLLTITIFFPFQLVFRFFSSKSGRSSHLPLPFPKKPVGSTGMVGCLLPSCIALPHHPCRHGAGTQWVLVECSLSLRISCARCGLQVHRGAAGSHDSAAGSPPPSSWHSCWCPVEFTSLPEICVRSRGEGGPDILALSRLPSVQPPTDPNVEGGPLLGVCVRTCSRSDHLRPAQWRSGRLTSHCWPCTPSALWLLEVPVRHPRPPPPPPLRSLFGSWPRTVPTLLADSSPLLFCLFLSGIPIQNVFPGREAESYRCDWGSWLQISRSSPCLSNSSSVGLLFLSKRGTALSGWDTNTKTQTQKIAWPILATCVNLTEELNIPHNHRHTSLFWLNSAFHMIKTHMLVYE